jgi:histidinol dehydrogenase
VTKTIDDILISYKESNFTEKHERLRATILKIATFSYDTKEFQKVAAIIDDVRLNGDKAVAQYTKDFDKISLTFDQFRVPIEDLKKAFDDLSQKNPKLLKTIRKAITNVKKYQQKVFNGKDVTRSGLTGIKYTPIERIGICVPGASAPLFSTVIMTAVPAQVAGVNQIVVISPPRYNGTIHPVTLAVCHELDIEEVYRIGGVQAVAALAVGTATIKQVYKIVGPGNQWVQTAKKMLFGTVGIDSIASTSEVLIVADQNANPAWIAADMLSQAEHAPGSASLFTDSQKLANDVLDELKKQVEQLDRSEMTKQCLIDYSGIVVFENFDDVIRWTNIFASEHLQIQCGDKSSEIAKKIKNAGAIFIGPYSPVATGDYFAGPSHCLPTGTSARFTSALSSNDFIKATSIIEYSKEKLAQSADDIIRLAKTEGLDAHAKSVQIRQQKD